MRCWRKAKSSSPNRYGPHKLEKVQDARSGGSSALFGSNLMAVPLPVETVEPVPPLRPERSVLLWNVLALLIALAACTGSLWLSLAMDLRACPLCFYQRAFVFGAAAVLLMALLTDARNSPTVSLLALPLASAGLGVAAWHVYLERVGILECPEGIYGVGTAPQQSLTVFVLLVVVLAIGSIRRPAMVVGLVLGVLLAAAAVKSVHPVKLPAELLEGPIKICRPPQK